MITMLLPATLIESGDRQQILGDLANIADLQAKTPASDDTAAFAEQGVGDVVVSFVLPHLRAALKVLAGFIGQQAVEISKLNRSKLMFKCGDVSLEVETAEFGDIERLYRRIERLCATSQKKVPSP